MINFLGLSLFSFNRHLSETVGLGGVLAGNVPIPRVGLDLNALLQVLNMTLTIRQQFSLLRS